MKSFFKVSVAAVGFMAIGLAAGTASAVQGDAIGDTQTCLNLKQIESSPVIDSKTILIKMNAPKGYKRIDIAAPCGLDSTKSFAHNTSTNELCKTDSLKVLQEPGGFCMIKQIVTITEDEAKALEKSRK